MSQATKFRRPSEEYALTKASRRGEIQRRAALLQPPIPVGILGYMKSYQEALLIPAPMDDRGWDLLRPRLLAERVAAEKKAGKGQVIQAQTHGTGTQNNGVSASAAESIEITDAQWDEVQGPLRARLVAIANGFISTAWKAGYKSSKVACVRFAVESLLYVRKRFYQEIVDEDIAARSRGKEPLKDRPEGPWTRKLTIENMKWIYDLKIKPLIEPYAKEVFFCNGCEAGRKRFSLEGVLQHYAAKHTTGLSKGSIVVFWRAEWPSIPPFSPDPLNPGQTGDNEPPKMTNAQAKKAKKLTEGVEASGGVAPQRASSPSRQMLITADSHREQPAAEQGNDEQSFLRGTLQDIWDTIGKHDDIVPTVRVAVLVHHAAVEFRARFSHVPSLQQLMRSVPLVKTPKQLDDMSGIRCKACQRGHSAHIKMTFGTLLAHFGQKHVCSSSIDWRTDMVLLPELAIMQKIPKQLERHPAAMKLVSDAMPWVVAKQTSLSRPGPPPGAPTGPRAALGAQRNRPIKATQGKPQANQEPSSVSITIHGNANQATNLDDDYSPPPAVSPHQEVASQTVSLHETLPPRPQVQPVEDLIQQYSDGDQPNLRPASVVYGVAKKHSQQRPPPDGFVQQLIQGPDQVERSYDSRWEIPPAQFYDQIGTVTAANRGLDHPRVQPLHDRLPPRHKREAMYGYSAPQYDRPVRPESSTKIYDISHSHAPANSAREAVDRTPLDPADQTRRRSVSPQRQAEHPSHTSYRWRNPPSQRASSAYAPEFSAAPVYRRVLEYELIRVRDPHGDYLLKRPVYAEDWSFEDNRLPIYEEHPPPLPPSQQILRRPPPQPPQQPVYYGQEASYGALYHQPAVQPHPLRMMAQPEQDNAMGEYDPRYPLGMRLA